jgi:hypothetical protein
VLKRISPKIWLPALTIAWGIVTMCLGFVRNYAGFLGVRAVLGITEGGLLPGMVSHFYVLNLKSSILIEYRFCTFQVYIPVVRWLSDLVYFTLQPLSAVLSEVSSKSSPHYPESGINS